MLSAFRNAANMHVLGRFVVSAWSVWTINLFLVTILLPSLPPPSMSSRSLRFRPASLVSICPIYLQNLPSAHMYKICYKTRLDEISRRWSSGCRDLLSLPLHICQPVLLHAYSCHSWSHSLATTLTIKTSTTRSKIETFF